MIAEDHTSARQAYAAILGAEPNMLVSGQAGNGLDLVKLMEKHRPDIVITDLDMPVMSGSKLIDVMKVRFPEVKTIVLSMHNEAEYISQLILDGANAYVPKSSDIEELILAINRVYEEGFYFNKVVSKIIVSNAIKKRDNMEPVFKQLSLSAREQDVLKLLCDEKTNKQIAESLNISLSTVDFHRQSIYKKTHASSVIGLVKYAIKNGITDLN
jgi:DNA-binding NarL/FixJ family response regulator